MTKSIITITADGEKGLDVRLEFQPAAKTHGPMTTDQAAAMAGLEAIKAWASGAGGEEVEHDEGGDPGVRDQPEGSALG